MLHIRVTSLVAVVAPHIGKIIKSGLNVFERAENYYKIMYFICV